VQRMSWTLDNLQPDSEYECLVQASSRWLAQNEYGGKFKSCGVGGGGQEPVACTVHHEHFFMVGAKQVRLELPQPDVLVLHRSQDSLQWVTSLFIFLNVYL
jgi:hypothetical protein